MSNLKAQLYQELELKVITAVEGINVDPHIFRHLDLGGRFQEEIHGAFEMDHETHVGIKFPAGFTSPHGLTFVFRWNRNSAYGLRFEGGSTSSPTARRFSSRSSSSPGRNTTVLSPPMAHRWRISPPTRRKGS